MTPPPLSEWLNELLLALQWLQNLVLLAWYWLTGQTTDFGQPAWPLEHRVAAEVLRIDHPLARQVLIQPVAQQDGAYAVESTPLPQPHDPTLASRRSRRRAV